MKPAYEQFLHGERGARVVVLPQAAASWLYRAANIQSIRERNQGVDPLIDAVLVAISLAALEATSAIGSRSAPRSEPVASFEEQQRTVTTGAIADQLNITRRAVVRAIADQRLPAVKDAEGRWRVTADEATRYVATRKETP